MSGKLSRTVLRRGKGSNPFSLVDFTSSDYKQLLKDYHIVQSMDGKSRWADNIMIERWFRSLKTEQLYPNEYQTPRELRQLINQYVDDYNSVRPHEALGYKVPNEIYFGCFAA